jgi:hypothetical protein
MPSVVCDNISVVREFMVQDIQFPLVDLANAFSVWVTELMVGWDNMLCDVISVVTKCMVRWDTMHLSTKDKWRFHQTGALIAGHTL